MIACAFDLRRLVVEEEASVWVKAKRANTEWRLVFVYRHATDFNRGHQPVHMRLCNRPQHRTINLDALRDFGSTPRRNCRRSVGIADWAPTRIDYSRDNPTWRFLVTLVIYFSRNRESRNSRAY